MSKPQPCPYCRIILAGMARSLPRLTRTERAEQTRQRVNACCNYPRPSRDG